MESNLNNSVRVRKYALGTRRFLYYYHNYRRDVIRQNYVLIHIKNKRQNRNHLKIRFLSLKLGLWQPTGILLLINLTYILFIDLSSPRLLQSKMQELI